MSDERSINQNRSNITDSNHPDWKAYRPEGHGHTDEQIRADVHELLQREGSGGAKLEIRVADGVVTLGGQLDDAIVERIRSLPSVKDVRAN